MRILVTGASGQLGYDVERELERRGIEHLGTSSRELDITDREAVERLMAAYRPDAAIHCAAYTKVDLAEDEPERCWAVNADGTRNMAAACRKTGAKLLYISTDYVFPGAGERSYETGDPTGPVNTYGRSKLAGELAVQSLLEKYFIVRISWVFGKNGNNFVKTMLRLAETKAELSVVCDQIGSPTYTADLAPLLCDMVQTERYGVYHATNEGTCAWSEFAEAIFELAGRQVVVHPIPTSAYPTRAARPLNSRMSKECLHSNGFQELPEWKNALARYLKEITE
ncbi:MAG: dTDP-4-dehydrorhamnose reductase [Clostridiales bacterium 52_15]|nr:MAG: dTDP-4-dehydrorhamnose reductase [Clostridiales bacterium 52_15]